MPLITCNDGFSVSVQASHRNYCSPREDDAPAYSRVELGFPSAEDSIITRFAENPSDPTETVYGWVPAPLVLCLIGRHGGLAPDSEALPPLATSPEDAAEFAVWLAENPEVGL